MRTTHPSRRRRRRDARLDRSFSVANAVALRFREPTCFGLSKRLEFVGLAHAETPLEPTNGVYKYKVFTTASGVSPMIPPVDDQPRIALHYGDRVERGREPLGHRGDADVPGDVTQSFQFGQPEIAERARDRPPGMVGSQYEIGAPIGAEQPHRGRFVWGEQTPRALSHAAVSSAGQ